MTRVLRAKWRADPLDAFAGLDSDVEASVEVGMDGWLIVHLWITEAGEITKAYYFLVSRDWCSLPLDAIDIGAGRARSGYLIYGMRSPAQSKRIPRVQKLLRERLQRLGFAAGLRIEEANASDS